MGMSMGGGGGKKAKPTPDVNVTPLVDICLVVLIIFMVMTPMMTKTFWLNLPDKPDEEQKDPPPPNPNNKPLVMTVDQEGVIRVNKTVLKKEEIASRLPPHVGGHQGEGSLLRCTRQGALRPSFGGHGPLPSGRR